MKNKKSFSNFFFHPNAPGLIILLLLFFNSIAIAQEQTQTEEFIIGAPFTGIKERRSETMYYDTFYTSGMNSIFQWAVNGPNGNKNLTQRFNLIAVNQDSLEWPGYYATCYYTKWEAEQNQTDPERVGVKHVGGQSFLWHDTLCWSTRNVIAPACSLIYGPHYRQDNRYKNWAHGDDRYDVRYYARYRMALQGEGNPDLPVCKIKVVYRYAEVYPSGSWQIFEHTFLERTLTVGDFPQGGYFKYFYLDDDTSWYKYPSQFQLPKYAGKLIEPEPVDTITYNDSEAGLGIQFWVDWLIDSIEESGLTLYVDHIEVFDEDWEPFLNPLTHDDEVAKIQTYAANFSDWTNIKYFMGMDEPYTIDAFTPLRIVDSLLENSQNPRLLSVFNPYWSHNNKINGDTLLSQFAHMANPEQLIVDIYPFAVEFPIARFNDFEYLRYTFQKCHTLRQGFWYMGQAAGEYTWNGNQWIPWVWRYPTDHELNASLMLALAHGSKGLFFWIYDSYTYGGYSDTLLHLMKGLREKDANFSPTPLWYYLKDDLVPRLKGKLGKTLMNLDYTGNYLQLKRKENEESPPPTGANYLTITPGTPEQLFMNWHCGFFSCPSYPDDNYFMLANLITTVDRHIQVTVRPPDETLFKNFRFRNVEGLFDTTFCAPNNLTKQINYAPGEGYLYQVAPVLLFGGRLLYDEYTGEGQILTDDMIIENGKTLSISGNYYADGNIIIKNGSIVNDDNGRIQFANGKKLIIQGSATITGTSNQKLILDFISPDYENGITIREGGSLTIFDCKIQNAQMGITSELNANYFNIQYVDFEDCGTHSINIFGRGVGQLPTPPSQIKFCSITNSSKGISVANTSQIIIQKNTFTNTELGILLSQVTNPSIVDNIIQSNLGSMEGIFGSSIGGTIRGNYISGHSTGIRLGNSSVLDIGTNTITYCKIHAMYIGTGSNPNMVGRFAKDASRVYPVSGYNDFINNGGYSGEGDDNDGSEIFFSEANAIMRDGCNSIVDDREPDGELKNTLLLMNSPDNGTPIEIRAENNYWGESRISEERFGNLTVYFDPYYTDECPVPDQHSDDEALITKTSSGEVIDTLYPANEDYYSLSGIEALYSLAGESFITGEMETAESYYNQIISSDTTIEVKKEAYCRKYEIGKILNRDAAYFSELRDMYSSISALTPDSLMKKIFDQLSSLCLTAQEEYLPPINEFDEIIQQNPNTEKAVYAEIDALTTALLIEGTDSTLHKGRLGKYLIKSSSDFNQRIDEILRKNFGGK